MGGRGDFRPKDGGNDSANLNGLGRMEARLSLCEIFRNDSISKIVRRDRRRGKHKGVVRVAFLRSRDLVVRHRNIAHEHKGRRGEKHLCPVGCWTKRISSPRDEADVNLRNRVTEKYLIINSYPPIFNSSPAAERAIIPSLAHFFFSNESTLPEHIFVHAEADICEIQPRFL